MTSKLERFKSGLPGHYRWMNHSKFPNQGLLQYLRRSWWPFWCELPEDPTSEIEYGSGLLLFGRSGAGKTHMSCHLVREALHDNEDYGGHFISMVQWASETTARAKACELNTWAWEEIEPVVGGDSCGGYLILDDIDKVRGTPAVQSELFNLLEQAMGHNITLLVTTQCGAGELAQRFDRQFGEAIVRRIRDCCHPINCDVVMPTTKAKASATAGHVHAGATMDHTK